MERVLGRIWRAPKQVIFNDWGNQLRCQLNLHVILQHQGSQTSHGNPNPLERLDTYDSLYKKNDILVFTKTLDMLPVTMVEVTSYLPITGTLRRVEFLTDGYPQGIANLLKFAAGFIPHFPVQDATFVLAVHECCQHLPWALLYAYGFSQSRSGF